ncbi:MAG: ABC transporter ATP-binding protein [Anaerolineae bacterium]|jgi:ABC-2 type transport system ATP-binding protein|nr:ABC transporter ATP-binding protein [Anaerolineae bacterium]
MIKVDGVKRAYGAIQALNGISFEVKEGEIVGLLGPNGAGKSTTIKILTGFLHPDEGTVHIDGHDVLTQTQQVQRNIGYLAENTPLYPTLSVQTYLKWIADMREIPINDQRKLISDAVIATGLQNHLTRPIAQLSKGYRQRVGLAQAILHKPKLLILDEPTVGLDPTQIVEIRGLIKRLAEHSTILFSSHILSEVEAVCDRVIIIMNGQIRADARLDELSATTNAVIVLSEPVDSVESALMELDGVSNVQPFHAHGGYLGYRVVANRDICPAIYDLAKRMNYPLRELRPDTLTLEAFFNQLATSA